jgi:hypothetical protein
MAEERNLGLARAPEASGDADSTKAELQRRMEEARESISQTVTEIKETVVNQYQQVKETISDTLDWREQYRRRPLPFTIGAFAVGALVGYGVMGAFKSDDDGSEDEDGFDLEEERADRAGRSYASAPILGEHHAPTAYQRAASPASGEEAEGQSSMRFDSSSAGIRPPSPTPRPSYSSGYQASTAPQHAGASAGGAEEEEEEPKGPGLFERFKETKAYDKLTEELSTVGERVVEELSRTAQTVVVPLLLNKIKSLIGVDLSSQRQSQPRGLTGQQASQSGAGASAPSTSGAGVQDQSSGASASTSGAGGTGGQGAS